MRKRLLTTAALLFAVATACPATAQQIGQACQTDDQHLETKKSSIPGEGAIQCVPDSNGNYAWQAMGAGISRYDITGLCNVAGTLRWTGQAIQYCNGRQWLPISTDSKTVVVGGCQDYWSGCPKGYSATSFFIGGACYMPNCPDMTLHYTVCSQ